MPATTQPSAPESGQRGDVVPATERLRTVLRDVEVAVRRRDADAALTRLEDAWALVDEIEGARDV